MDPASGPQRADFGICMAPRDTLKLSMAFVVHSLCHAMLMRLGEARADAFTIRKIAGNCRASVSQRYVHQTPDCMERAVERLQELSAVKAEEANAEAAAVGAEGRRLPTKAATSNAGFIEGRAKRLNFRRMGP